jgi:hypothetical protein
MGCKRRMEVIGRIGDVQHTPKYNNETYTKDDALGVSASGPISATLASAWGREPHEQISRLRGSSPC